jgi:selenocysteine lyase/cysteine desulfurase
MMTAEHERLILTEWRQFWMGHAGNIESTYSVNKKLPPEVIDTMRQAYSQAAGKHLVTASEPTISKDEVINTARVEALKMFGYSDEELAALGDVTQLTMERLQELIHQKSKLMLGLKEGTQKVVPVTELERWIEEGWDYKRDLPNEKAVIGLRGE